MERRLPQFFFALSMIVLALMLGAIWQAGTPAWRTYQQEFRRLEAAGEPNAAAKSGVLDAALVIRQDLLPGLQRVDRCTTCHQGAEDPTQRPAAERWPRHWSYGRTCYPDCSGSTVAPPATRAWKTQP